MTLLDLLLCPQCRFDLAADAQRSLASWSRNNSRDLDARSRTGSRGEERNWRRWRENTDHPHNLCRTELAQM